MKKTTVFCSILFLLFMAIPVHANTLHLTNGDTYLDSQNPTVNYGNQKKIKLKKTDSQEISAFLKYDFSTVPADFNINNIYELNLKLWPHAITHAGAIEVFFIFDTWNEHRLLTSNKPHPIISSEIIIPITLANLNNHIEIDLKKAVNLLLGPDPATGIMLKPLNNLDMTFMAKEIDVGADGARLASAMEIKMIGNSAGNAHPAISVLQTASTNLSGNVSTNAGNISLNAGEISTNTNKNISQETTINANSARNTAQEMAITTNVFKINNNTTANVGQNHTIVNLRNMIRDQTSSINTNTTKNTAQNSSILANTTKNTTQDALINSMDDMDSVDIHSVRKIIHTITKNGITTSSPALDIRGTNLYMGDEFDAPLPVIRFGEYLIAKLYCETITVGANSIKQIIAILPPNQAPGTYLLRLTNTIGQANHTITIGAVGERGLQGLRGLAGNDGERGPQGRAGIDGISPITTRGPKGDKGDNGSQGLRGLAGNNGNEGADGATGSQGLKGDTGIKGSQGIAGNNGNDGARGSQGLKGATGARGSQGATGARGSQGLKGLTGATGPAGMAGGCFYNGLKFSYGACRYTGRYCTSSGASAEAQMCGTNNKWGRRCGSC